MSYPERFLSVQQLCELLGVSRSTVYRLRQEGLPYLTVRGSLRFDRDQVLRYLSGDREEPVKEAPEVILQPGLYRCTRCGAMGGLNHPLPAYQMRCMTCGAVNEVQRV